MSNNDSLHIGFISTRFAGTDGVSQETEKWERVFEEFGHESFWFAGELDRPLEKSLLVPEAFFNQKENIKLNDLIFTSQYRTRETTDLIQSRKEFLKNKIYLFYETFKIDMIVAENCLAIPMQVPLAIALTEFIAETGITVIGHHHDFYWERSRFLISGIQDILTSSFPPDLPSIHHVVINSMIQKDLAAKRGLSSMVIPNVIDFDNPNGGIDNFNKTFREDLGFKNDDILILQPTRIVSRKGIEQAIYLVKRLNLPNVKLLISHSAGDEGSEYYDWVIDTARQQDISIHFLYNRLNEKRKIDKEGNKLYCLWDIYPNVDMVTYPSLYEGFGNAFLEAVYFKKPLLVNRYSVYIVDIEPKGFDVVTMDGYLSSQSVEQVLKVLTDDEYRNKMVEKNYRIGRKYFSMNHLKEKLNIILESI